MLRSQLFCFFLHIHASLPVRRVRTQGILLVLRWRRSYMLFEAPSGCCHQLVRVCGFMEP